MPFLVMSVWSWAKQSQFRLWATCSAAMNWPCPLKPDDAWFSVIVPGSSAVIFALSCGCDEILVAIGFKLVVVLVGVVAVVEFVDVDLPVGCVGCVTVVGALPCCAAGPC